jgi:hypothetical protein
MPQLKWKETREGAVIKTDTLQLVVREAEGGGYEYVVYNTGRYVALKRSEWPFADSMEDAKRQCVAAAKKILNDELVALYGVGWPRYRPVRRAAPPVAE